MVTLQLNESLIWHGALAFPFLQIFPKDARAHDIWNIGGKCWEVPREHSVQWRNRRLGSPDSSKTFAFVPSFQQREPLPVRKNPESILTIDSHGLFHFQRRVPNKATL